MSPGTVYSDTACRITILDETIAVEAVANHVGMGFWLFPIVQNRTFRHSLERQANAEKKGNLNR